VKKTTAKHVHDNLIINHEGNLVIEATNADGTPNFLGGDSFDISAMSPTPADIVAYEGARPGHYIVRYTFHDTGSHELSIKMNGEHIGNSPLTIVRPS